MAFPLLAAYESAGRLNELSFDFDQPLVDAVGDPQRRAEVEREVSAALLPIDGTDTFGAASPGIFRLLDDELPYHRLGTRAANIFRSKRFSTWRHVAYLTPTDVMSFADFGETSLRRVAEAAVGDAIDALLKAAPDDAGEGSPLATVRTSADRFVLEGKEPAASEAPLLVSTIDAVASWAVAEGDQNNFGDIIRLVDGTELPPRLRRRWQQLSTVSLEVFSTKPLDIGALVSELLDRVDGRLRRILRYRVWPSPVRATLEDLGEQLGMTRERVRQIASHGVSELRHWLEDEHFAPIGDRAFELRRRLGAAVPLHSSALANAKYWATRDVEPHDRTDGWELLLWLAGPYKESGEWLVARSDGPDPKGGDLRKRAQSSGFISHETVASVLNEAGIRTEWHGGWLERCGGFRPVEGGLLDASGGIIDQALRYLDFRGIPLTIEEILGAIGRTDASTRSVRQRLFEHPRVVRCSKSEVGLREWGVEEFTTIPDEMAEEIERAGGSIPLDVLVERLVGRFGVSATSIRMYTGRPMFITDDAGSVRVRVAEDEQYELRDDLSTLPACYELTSTTAAWRVRVDRDMLRGSGRHIPEQLAGWLRLRPGARLTLFNGIHPLALSWRPWSQPDVGSLKSFADALGAAIGDWLVLVFDRSGTVEARLVNDDDSDPLHRLAAMVGIDFPPEFDREEVLIRLAVAFGVDTSDVDSLPFRIRRTVDVRKDLDLADIAEEALLG